LPRQPFYSGINSDTVTQMEPRIWEDGLFAGVA